MNNLQKFYILLLVIVCPLSVRGQALSTQIPLYKDAVEGQLPNGLRYIVHRNANPKGKIEFRMVLNIGSVLEDSEQKGMSHFIEHMAFNGSKYYPGNEAVSLLQAMGIKYGYDLNAFTSNDKTIYILPVPTDRKENIDIALNILYSWLTDLNLYPNDIEKEKKIVAQEIRDASLHDIFYNTKISGSRYAETPVLGSEESIQKFDSTSIRTYYDKWYRPDMTTIIAVGDLDTKEMVKKIDELFSKAMPRTSQPPLRTSYSLPVKGEPIIQQEVDTLLSTNILDIIFPEIMQPIVTYQDLRNGLLEQLFSNMLSDRISNNKSLKSHYSRTWYLSNIAHRSFEISAQTDSAVYTSVRELPSLLAQIKQHGFTPNELENTKSALLNRLSKEDYIRTSESYCNDYIDLATTGDRYIGNKAKYDFYSSAIKTVTVDEFKEMTDVFFDKSQQIILCYLYNSQLSAPLQKDSILSYWNQGLTSRTNEYRFIEKKVDDKESEKQSQAILEVKDIADAHILTEKVYSTIGVTELILSNGLRVALKPITQSDNKNIMITLMGKGGFSNLPIDKYPYINGAAAYVDMSGVDTLSPESLGQLCYEKEIALSTNIDNYYHEIYGIAFEGNIDDLLKLIYLKINYLKKNQADFDAYIDSQISSLGREDWLMKQINRDPSRVLQNKVARYSGNIHKNNRELTTKEELLKINLDENLAFFEQLFTHGELTAVITGTFDIDSIKAKIVKYLGALPNKGSQLQIQDIGDHFPQKTENYIIKDATATRANITHLIYGKYEHTLRESIIFKMMRDIISNRMLSSLREKEGLVYSPYVTVSYKVDPDAEFCFNINYYCDTAYSSLLEKLIWSTIEILKTELIPDSELNSIKQSFLISKRENLSDSNTTEWRNKLKEMYLENNSIADFANYDQILSRISVEDIRDSFRKYIHSDHSMTISILNDDDSKQ